MNEKLYMRGEPIEALSCTLINGMKPATKRDNIGGHESHAPNKIALGYGTTSGMFLNPAMWKQFGGTGKIIYVIDDRIRTLKHFRKKTELEYHVKVVPVAFIKKILVHKEDSTKFNKIIEDNNLKNQLNKIEIDFI